jgi:hypothetical protein
MQSGIEQRLTVYNIHIYTETILKLNLGETQGEFYMQGKGDYLDRVNSDQMVLEIVRWGG